MVEQGLELGGDLRVVEHDPELLGNILAQLCAGVVAAPVGYDDGVDLTGLGEQRLRPTQWHYQRGVDSREAASLQDTRDDQGLGPVLQEKVDLVTGPCVELLHALLRDEDLASGEALQPGLAPSHQGQAAEAFQHRRVQANQIHPALGELGPPVLDGDRVGYLRHNAVDLVVGSQVGAYLLGPLLGEVDGAEAGIVPGPPGHDQHVDLPEAGDRLVADREAEGVAGAEGGRHDHRAQHDPHDDEGGLAGPTRNGTQPHLEHDPVPSSQHPQRGHRRKDDRQQHVHQGRHREAEKLFHLPSGATPIIAP